MKLDAKRIRQLRSDRQWTQEQLAEVCGLNLRTIQRVERQGQGSGETLRALASVFEVPAESLIATTDSDASMPLRILARGFERYHDFEGRDPRSDYWWFFGLLILGLAICQLIHPVVLALASLITLLPLLAAGSRRLRDAGHSPWWQLFFLVPFGFVPVLILMALPSAAAPETEQTSEQAG
ncbi:DUF805 domain-containing protein [Wenzhouxiangella marina]|uniref:XRE family transcriptional regulator n=1 Tax=Wenzhouxiangella marina TaxID=1579979 RepID=A0A0K0XZH4_9GAMM|nr:DUF805 domain-containing protein [Wenzhouxiangella marina]AKS43084.1 XRE family transcriptional regulator [Wenzhouxiangella marina]MBB6087232.1 transcriptional regulator with XRE-family HTH domain [Wenzhouxiangella marina]